MEETKELGIELLKKFFKNGVNALNEYREAKADDGKVTKMEWIGLGDNAVAIGSNLLKMNTIIAEAKDADTDERKELLTYIVSLGVLGDKAKIILVNGFEYIEGQVLLFNTNIVPIINVLKNKD